MTPFAFDTLSASKRLREAGMAEGVAEAVVSVFQHAAEMPDVSHLATKDDVYALRGDVDALRGDVDALRTTMNDDLEALRTATQKDIDLAKLELRAEIIGSEVKVRETIRLQGWAIMGGTITIVTMATALIKLA